MLKENHEQKISLAAQEKEISTLKKNEDEIKETLLVHAN